MPLTANDILDKEFRLKLRGYDTDEVDDFLEEVAEALAEMNRENNTLKDRLKAMEQKMDEYRRGEEDFKQAVLSAHKLAEEMKAQTSKEAEVIIEKARMEADKIVSEAHREVTGLEEKIQGLRRLHREAVAKIRATIEGYLRIIDEDLERRIPEEGLEGQPSVGAQAQEESDQVEAPAPSPEPIHSQAKGPSLIQIDIEELDSVISPSEEPDEDRPPAGPELD